MQSISERVGLTVTPQALQLPPGGWMQVTVALTNLEAVVDQFELQVEGPEAGWFTVPVATLSLFPGAAGTLAVEIQVPEQPAPPAGVHQIPLQVIAHDEAGAAIQVAAVDLAVEVLPAGGLELGLAPRRVTTRGKGHFRVQLTNGKNTDQAVDLIVSDPEAALDARFVEDRVAVPAGGHREAALVLRPKRRPLVAAPRHYPFNVTVFPAGSDAAEPLGILDGGLVYQAPLAFLATWPRRLRRLAVGLLALLLVAAVAIWFLGAPVRRAAATVASGAAKALDAVATELSPDAVQSEAPAQTDAAAAPGAAAQPAGAGAGASGSGAPATGAAAPSSPAAVLPPPVISKFELNVPAGAGRGEFELSWAVQGADKVELDGAAQPASGSQRVQTQQDREFQLTATNKDGAAVTKSIGVVLLRPPEIQKLEASAPEVVRGQPVTLTWQARRGARAALDGQPVDPSAGAREVRPEADTTYTLVVENEFGRVEQQVTVHVVDPAP